MRTVTLLLLLAASCGGPAASKGSTCRSNSDCQSNVCANCTCPDSKVPACPPPSDGGKLEYEETCRCS